MNEITAWLVLLFLTCLFLSVFYWWVMQRVLIKRLLYRLFARRDELRRLAITRKEDHTCFSYKGVEGFICKTIAIVPFISLASFIQFVMRTRNQESSYAEQMHKEASPDLKILLDKTVRDALIIMSLNSPILFFGVFALSLLLWIVGRFNKMFVLEQAESFVDEFPSDKNYRWDNQTLNPTAK